MMRLLYIVLILITTLFGEAQQSNIYFKVGWGIDNLSYLQAGNSTSSKSSSMQNVEIGYDINLVRLSTFIKSGQDTVPNDTVTRIGYKLGFTTKNIINIVLKPVRVVPVLTLNSSYFGLQSNSNLSGNAIGASLLFDIHFDNYEFIALYVEYEYERSAIYDSQDASTDFYKVDSNLLAFGFSVIF